MAAALVGRAFERNEWTKFDKSVDVPKASKHTNGYKRRIDLFDAVKEAKSETEVEKGKKKYYKRLLKRLPEEILREYTNSPIAFSSSSQSHSPNVLTPCRPSTSDGPVSKMRKVNLENAVSYNALPSINEAGPLPTEDFEEQDEDESSDDELSST